MIRTKVATSKGPVRRAPARPVAQMQPAPERYKEIQQALADKGFFHGNIDGTWGADSVDALKRFQAQQNLDNDGKVSSLSLIALGLGPKHESYLTKPAGAATVPSETTVEPPPVALPSGALPGDSPSPETAPDAAPAEPNEGR